METFFVHRFSHATSPLSNVYRNCAYYWTFGCYIAYYVNHPLYTPVSDLQMKIGFGFGILCQVSNFYCHILLRNLRRPEGDGGYQIPSGFLFNIVTCANYTTEIYQWVGFNIATQTVAGYVFVVVAAGIMTNWALAKHRRLRKVSFPCSLLWWTETKISMFYLNTLVCYGTQTLEKREICFCALLVKMTLHLENNDWTLQVFVWSCVYLRFLQSAHVHFHVCAYKLTCEGFIAQYFWVE